MPAEWGVRMQASRKAREQFVAEALQKGPLQRKWALLQEWEQYFMREAFYTGIRALFELEREGFTKL